MKSLEFDAAFLALYGSTYTPKFATYYDFKNLFMLMDNDSGGPPLIVKVAYSIQISDGTFTQQLNTISFDGKTLLTASDLYVDASGVNFMVKDSSVSPQVFYFAG